MVEQVTYPLRIIAEFLMSGDISHHVDYALALQILPPLVSSLLNGQ
uniref:Uncharacterized protein n=1 Tax=Arundo donax TaxID=35708 RepID=A0A0A9AUR4_ARUDO